MEKYRQNAAAGIEEESKLLEMEIDRQKPAEDALQENEANYRALFEYSPVSLWEEDFSDVKQHIDRLRASGVSNFQAYFDEHPEDVSQFIRDVKIIRVNQATFDLFKADSKDDLFRGLDVIFSKEAIDIFKDVLIAFAGGDTQLQTEVVLKSLADDKLFAIARIFVVPGHINTWGLVILSVSDITDRKQTEIALRINKERYGEAQAVGLAGNWEYNLQTNHFWGSEEARRIYGFDSEDDDFSVDEIEKCIPERERIHQALIDLIEVNKPYNLEFEIHPRSSLTPRIISSIAELKRDELGNPLLVTGVIQDITRRKRIEEDLRDSEEQFRLLSEATFEAIVIHEEGVVLSANDQYFKMFGYEPDEILGKDMVSKTIAPEAFELVRKRIAAGNIESYESTGLRKDGTRFPIEVRIRKMKYKGRLVRFGAIRDITERKQAEEKFRHLAAIVESSNDAIIGKTLDGTVISWNKGAERIYGYLADEVMGKSILCIVPLDRRDEIDWILEKTRHGEAIMPYEAERMNKDGTRIWVSLTVSPVKNTAGDITGASTIARDITDQKKAENSILASLRLLQFAQTHSLEELLQETIDEVEEMTDSQAGFLHFLAADQRTLSMQMWSTRTLQKMQKTKGKGRCDNIEQAGAWVECVRERKPVIHNDYSALPHKKGIAPSHAGVIRELVVPVFRGDRIVTILGVCSKGSDYNESDIRTASLFADLAWDIAERKQAETALQQSEEKYRSIFENSPEGIFQSTPEGRFISVNPALARMYGYDSPEEMMAATVDIGRQIYVDAEERIRYLNILDEFGTVLNFEIQSRGKSGEVMWVSLNAREKRNADGDILCYDGFAKDITSRKLTEIDLEKTAEKLRKSLMNTIQALSVTVEIRDPYTSGHQKRVSLLTRAIAEGMSLAKDTVDNLCMASIIHDIGKLSLPSEILSKPGKLSDIEFSLIKTHSQSGYDIIKDIGLPYPIAEMVLQHHERIDGSGYPRGLKNDQILLESKIIIVADVVEAMASHRPYRPALGIDKALEEIEKYKGILYDPAVVDMCLELFRKRGFTFED